MTNEVIDVEAVEIEADAPTDDAVVEVTSAEIIDGFQTVFNELVVQKAAIAENLRQLGEVSARVNLLLQDDAKESENA
jgi:hypothetical protein